MAPPQRSTMYDAPSKIESGEELQLPSTLSRGLYSIIIYTAFGRSSVPPFRLSPMPPFRQSSMPPIRWSSIPPFRRSSMLPVCLSSMPPIRCHIYSLTMWHIYEYVFSMLYHFWHNFLASNILADCILIKLYKEIIKLKKINLEINWLGKKKRR